MALKKQETADMKDQPAVKKDSVFAAPEAFGAKIESLAVVGLGYVGLPLAVCLARHFKVSGYDVNRQRIAELARGDDRNGEVSAEDIRNGDIAFTSDPSVLKSCRFIIVTVPTPVDDHKNPDLTYLKEASAEIGRNLSLGTYIVFESTVYPGVTEDECVPVIEHHSQLACGVDFKVGYSPERINPGDAEHTISNTIKVVAGQDMSTVEIMKKIYGAVVRESMHVAPDIRTAEAAKVVENLQRDMNIALMNELSIIFNRLGIDLRGVLEAAGSKWNFLKFEPGLVGGHCIGVDPYYLTFRARQIGYHPTIILAGRQLNDLMGKYVAEETVKCMIESGMSIKGAKALILGMTFKENIKDVRNTKVADIYMDLAAYGMKLAVHDPYAIPEEVKREYGIDLVSDVAALTTYDVIIIAVRHRIFQKMGLAALRRLCGENAILIDVKSAFDRSAAIEAGFTYWSLQG